MTKKSKRALAAAEVEVRRGDGSQAGVHLDRNFNVIDESADGAGDANDSSGD